MDPVTQGALGAALAQTRGPGGTLAKSAAIGAFAGMTPDLDILIRSSTDPLLAVEFHRHFTHSLLFIPIGAWLCSLLLYPLLGRRWQLSYAQVLVWSLLGFATHALLDACTTYGTMLWWPLTDRRYELDIISVVDPLFSVPLLVLVILSAVTRRRAFVLGALAWGSLYMTAGYIQHERAEAIGRQLARERGHDVRRLEVKPSFGNIVVWKVMYESGDWIYVDAARPGFSRPKIWPGDRVRRLNIARDFPWLYADSQQARDIERFRRVSSGSIALDPSDPRRIGDIRYSMLPNTIAPLWGIGLSPTAGREEHVSFYTRRGDGLASTRRILEMMFE
jgi:inner membrane protein